jgi:hypothetical protein
VIVLALLVTCCRSGEAAPETTTACSINQFCYCVQKDFQDAVDKEVKTLRALIRKQKADSKAIGYLSIPLSGVGGSYFPLNARIAAKTKEFVEQRFGSRSAFVLNSGADDISLPKGASQADYLFMWTQVLEGETGKGEDFDFIYFVGPSDFGRYFGLDGHNDMTKLENWYDGAITTDANLKSVDRSAFRTYYALRASGAYSIGAHDEWNVVRAIDAARMKSKADYGIQRQLGVLFDGKGIAPGVFETQSTPGNAMPCDAK